MFVSNFVSLEYFVKTNLTRDQLMKPPVNRDGGYSLFNKARKTISGIYIISRNKNLN